jgi:hypothetical protein
LDEVDERDRIFALGVEREARLVEGRVEEASKELGVLLLEGCFEVEERRADDMEERFERDNTSEKPESCLSIFTAESTGDEADFVGDAGGGRAGITGF